MKYFKKLAFLLLVFTTFGQVFGNETEPSDASLFKVKDVKGNNFTQQLLNTYTDDRKYSEVCWLTTHNAFANGNQGWSYQQQNLDFEEQYELGVRSFMVDLYLFEPGSTLNEAGETVELAPYIAMCHEPGFLNGRNCLATRLMLKNGHPEPFLNVLLQIRDWMIRDSDTIITLQIESRFGDDGAQEALHDALEEAGLTKYLYIPQVKAEEITDWPTLGELRSSNKSLVLFSDNPNDGVIHTSVYRETRFDLSRFSDCEMREDDRDTEKIMPLFVLNHFHSLSIRLNGFWRDYEEVNSYKNIMKRVSLCEHEHNMLPNFIVMDFVEEGELGGALQAVSNINLQPKERFAHKVINQPLSQKDLDIYAEPLPEGDDEPDIYEEDEGTLM